MAALELDPQLLVTELKTLEQNINEDNRFIAMAMTALRLTTSTKLQNQQVGDSENTLNEITLDEVSNHDHINDCWIIIYDRVYDITKFLKQHPGGYDVILEYAGRDASLAFRGTGHSDVAIKSLKKWEIGQLPKHECIFRCKNGFKITDLPE